MRLSVLALNVSALLAFSVHARADDAQCRNELALALAKTQLPTVAYREETVSTSAKGTLRRIIVRLPNGDFHARAWIGPAGAVPDESQPPESGEQLSIGKTFYSRLGKTWTISKDEASPLPVMTLEARAALEAKEIASAKCKPDTPGSNTATKQYQYMTPTSQIVQNAGVVTVDRQTGRVLQTIIKQRIDGGAPAAVRVTYTYDPALKITAPKTTP
jgi:hypothetical protein